MRPRRRARPRGTAAVELALLLPLAVLPVGLSVLVLGSVLQQYAGADQAAYAAARYLAQLPRAQLASEAGADQALLTARAIAAGSLAAAGLPPFEPKYFSAQCDPECGKGGVPLSVSVKLTVHTLPDWSEYAAGLLGDGRRITVRVALRYER